MEKQEKGKVCKDYAYLIAVKGKRIQLEKAQTRKKEL